MNELFKASTEDPLEIIATFRMGEAWYGFNARLIQEVIRLDEVTAVTGASDFIVGIINLRGKIVTVLDLAGRLGLPPCADPSRKPVLIVPFQQEWVGILVDEIDDVIYIDPDALESLPSNVDKRLQPHFTAVHRKDDSLVTILNPLSVLRMDSEGPVTP